MCFQASPPDAYKNESVSTALRRSLSRILGLVTKRDHPVFLVWDKWAAEQAPQAFHDAYPVPFFPADGVLVDPIAHELEARLDASDIDWTHVERPSIAEPLITALKLVVTGDFFQLPPVSDCDESEEEYAFLSPKWSDVLPKARCFSLMEIHRQSDTGLSECFSGFSYSSDISSKRFQPCSE